VQSEVDAAIKKLQELKLVLGEHQKVNLQHLCNPAPWQIHTTPTLVTAPAPCRLLVRRMPEAKETPALMFTSALKFYSLIAATVALLQAYEKTTGKTSSQNKEAFRANLVRGSWLFSAVTAAAEAEAAAAAAAAAVAVALCQQPLAAPVGWVRRGLGSAPGF
jgi:hypothetical protein